MNIALQMKLIWKIITEPTNVWVKITKENYLKGTYILEFQKKPYISWQFGRLLNLSTSFQKGVRWEIGNRKKINFQKDLWIGKSKLEPFRNNEDDNTEVDKFIDSNRDWNRQKLEEVIPSTKVSELMSKKS